MPMRFAFGDKVVDVNMPDQGTLLQAVTRRFLSGDGFALATINLDHLVKLSGSEKFRMAYAAQDFVVADGNPIVWLSHLAGRPVKLVPGSDLVEPLARRAAASGVEMAFVGSTQDSLDLAAARLTEMVPGLSVVATLAPPMGFDPESAAADDIFAQLDRAGARLVFLALGAPKQEIMAARGREAVPHIGFASIGAGLDFIAGRQKRAPKIVRALAMEWAWRMVSNPRRLLWRYLQCMAILPSQVLAALRLRKSV